MTTGEEFWVTSVGLLVIPVLAALLTLLGTAVVSSRQKQRERRSDAARILIRAVIDSGEDAYRENWRSLGGPATFELIAAGMEFVVEQRGKNGEVSIWVMDQIVKMQDDSAFADPVEFATRTRLVAGKLADWAAGARPTRLFLEELAPKWRDEYLRAHEQHRSNGWWRRMGRWIINLVSLKPVKWHSTWVEKEDL